MIPQEIENRDLASLRSLLCAYTVPYSIIDEFEEVIEYPGKAEIARLKAERDEYRAEIIKLEKWLCNMRDCRMCAHATKEYVRIICDAQCDDKHRNFQALSGRKGE